MVCSLRRALMSARFPEPNARTCAQRGLELGLSGGAPGPGMPCLGPLLCVQDLLSHQGVRVSLFFLSLLSSFLSTSKHMKVELAAGPLSPPDGCSKTWSAVVCHRGGSIVALWHAPVCVVCMYFCVVCVCARARAYPASFSSPSFSFVFNSCVLPPQDGGFLVSCT